MTKSVADLLTGAAKEQPARVAVVEASGGRRLTWEQLDLETTGVSNGYGNLGMIAGYRVVIALGNRIEFVTCYLAALRSQLVAVPVNPRATASEFAAIITDCAPRLVIVDGDTSGPVREALRDLAAEEGPESGAVRLPGLVCVGTPVAPGEHSYGSLATSEGRPVPPLVDGETIATLLYTSGTSGRPRGAMLSHRAMVANIEQVAQVEPPMIGADDVVLGMLPLFHVYGLNAVLGGVLRQRARLVLAEGFHPSGTLDLIEDEAISVVPVAPPVFAHWLTLHDLAERFGPTRLVLSGSAPLEASVIDDFTARTKVPVHQGYGLTEASPVVTSTLCSTDAPSGSVGAGLPGIELRLVDEHAHPSEGSDPGEIHIRGHNLFSGYWPDGSDGPDDDGWWATGDVGLLNDSGDLTLVDRIKELVIVSGFNVYPSEVEDVISEVPGVAAAAIIGVPDAVSGESVVAYVLSHGQHTPQELEAAVREHASLRLARFKQPSEVCVVNELPYTVTGKVQKGRLRAAARRRTTPLLDQ